MVCADTINVSLVCSNSIVSEGLKSILLDENFAIAGQHKSCRAIITAKEEGATDDGLIVIDSSVSRNVSQEIAAVHAAYPNSNVVLLHDDLEIDRLIEAFDAGADGYVLKEMSCTSLINCLQLAAQGEKVVPGELVAQLPHYAVASTDQAKAEGELSELLSEREIETLRCLVMGYPNKVVARRLEIGEATVKVHVKAILRKLMVQNRTQAAIWAVNHGVQATTPSMPMKSKDADMEIEDVALDSSNGCPGAFMLADQHAPEEYSIEA